jgi:hypothetical protein
MVVVFLWGGGGGGTTPAAALRLFLPWPDPPPPRPAARGRRREEFLRTGALPGPPAGVPTPTARQSPSVAAPRPAGTSASSPKLAGPPVAFLFPGQGAQVRREARAARAAQNTCSTPLSNSPLPPPGLTHVAASVAAADMLAHARGAWAQLFACILVGCCTSRTARTARTACTHSTTGTHATHVGACNPLHDGRHQGPAGHPALTQRTQSTPSTCGTLLPAHAVQAVGMLAATKDLPAVLHAHAARTARTAHAARCCPRTLCRRWACWPPPRTCRPCGPCWTRRARCSATTCWSSSPLVGYIVVTSLLNHHSVIQSFSHN